MENLKTLSQIIKGGEFMVKVDIQDAYLNVPMHRKSMKYLGLQIGKSTYQFTSLCFGLNIAPQVFTRIMKAALKPLRRKGLRIVAYLDDLLILGDTAEQAKDSGEMVVKHLETLGFLINSKKTDLEPKQTREFLGMIVCTKTMQILTPDEKLKRIAREAKVRQSQDHWTMRKWSSTIGLILSVSRGMQIGQLMCRAMLRDLRLAMARNRGWKLDALVEVSGDSRQELQWWNKEAWRYNGKPLHQPTPKLTLTTDASSIGWGAVLGDRTFQGKWEGPEMELTSNQIEALAILKALQTLKHELSGNTIRILSDNTATVANIAKQGGTHSLAFQNIITQIWKLLVDSKIGIQVQHIAGKSNSKADRASRVFLNPKDEYSLREETMDWIRQELGDPMVDLFATEKNHQTKDYFSRFQESEAMGTDSFRHPWRDLGLTLANPPITLITKVFKKFLADQCHQMILITPEWETIPCMAAIRKLTVRSIPLTLKDFIYDPGDRISFKGFKATARLISRQE